MRQNCVKSLTTHEILWCDFQFCLWPLYENGNGWKEVYLREKKTKPNQLLPTETQLFWTNKNKQTKLTNKQNKQTNSPTNKQTSKRNPNQWWLFPSRSVFHAWWDWMSEIGKTIIWKSYAFLTNQTRSQCALANKKLQKWELKVGHRLVNAKKLNGHKNLLAAAAVDIVNYFEKGFPSK